VRSSGQSEAVEMYLKHLALLGGAEQAVPASLLADRLSVSAVATNEMLRRLIRDDLVRHEPYRGYGLTDSGRQAAWDVIRRERLWERFLVDHLGLDPAVAVASACELEHATTAEVIEALDAFLGRPATCPMGQPIPRNADDPVHWGGRTLAEAEPGEDLRLVAFDEDDPEILGWLHRGGLAAGSVVHVVDVAPHHSTTTLAFGGTSLAIGRTIAGAVRIEPVESVA
jgi:DtxR family transcriptional regulator, Mn-dependent transcriptional regulator